MSWKPAFLLPGEVEYATNGQAFATKKEAEDSAQARFMIWTAPTAWKAIESDQPVNNQIEPGRDTPITSQGDDNGNSHTV